MTHETILSLPCLPVQESFTYILGNPLQTLRMQFFIAFEEPVVYKPLFLKAVMHVFAGNTQVPGSTFYRHYGKVDVTVSVIILDVHINCPFLMLDRIIHSANLQTFHDMTKYNQ
jgi:hypothetical protein